MSFINNIYNFFNNICCCNYNNHHLRRRNKLILSYKLTDDEYIEIINNMAKYNHIEQEKKTKQNEKYKYCDICFGKIKKNIFFTCNNYKHIYHKECIDNMISSHYDNNYNYGKKCLYCFSEWPGYVNKRLKIIDILKKRNDVEIINQHNN